MARLLGGALLIALSLGVVDSGGAKSQALLGIERDGARPVALSRFDSETLRPLGPRVPLALHGRAWSRAPDGSQVVLAYAGTPSVGRPTSLRFVDVRKMRIRGDLSLRGETASVRATAWVRPRRLLALLADERMLRVLAIDAHGVKVVGDRKLPLGLVLTGGTKTPDGFVILLARRDAIGPATLATVDADLRVRTVRLSAIAAGSKYVRTGNDVEGATRRPAFAFDPSRRRAFVVSNGAATAEIDVTTMRVTYHRTQPSLYSAAKRIHGSWEHAAWLGDGLLAVAGWSYRPDNSSPTGLRVIDTRSWSERMIDPAVGQFRLSGDTLVAQLEDALFGYDAAGAVRFALPGQTSEVQAAAGRIYARSRQGITTILDGKTGVQLGSHRGVLPMLLADNVELF
jgi:hypothetical protein